MDLRRREEIQHSLRSLAEYYTVLMELLNQTFKLFCEELSLDPLTYLRSRQLPQDLKFSPQHFLIDRESLSVTFHGKTCFLSNTIPFKFLCHLARRPNTYISHEELLSEVWQGYRSDAAVRSVVKTLRAKLRQAGLAALAEAIDGSAAGHYSLKLDR